MLRHEDQASSAGFVIPAQPVKASRPPSGADWVHEIKHDGYRLIVRRDGPTVRLYTRNAYDWTAVDREALGLARPESCSTNTSSGMALRCSNMLAGLVSRASFQRRSTGPIDPVRVRSRCPCPVWVKVRNPASIAVQRERSEKWNR